MNHRLNQQQLKRLPADIILPQYDRSQVKAGILHIGTGAFHRAHQAVYVDDVLALEGGDWGIVGSSLRSKSVAEQLNPQDGLYTVLVRDSARLQTRVIGSVLNVLYAAEQSEELLDTLANPSIKIVTLTVTEKGYCHDPATGNLLINHRDVTADLQPNAIPKTLLGWLCRGLQRRKAAGFTGLTLLSCDNLPNNGRVLKKVLLQFSQRVDPALAVWIEKSVSFPCSMIDRIVPATTEEDRLFAAQTLACRDEGLVVTEPFSQWVIEDNFIAGRPAFEKVGVQMVSDVTAYEEIKLRFLNGAHSLLAYAGFLAGYQYIAQVVAQENFVAAVQDFWKSEVLPSVYVPLDFDIDAYQSQLLARFSNSALRHKTWQIAMDGSQKIPQRWLNTLRSQLASGGEITWLVFALANWIRYVRGYDEQGQVIDVQDPLALELRDLYRQYDKNYPKLVQGFLRLEQIFDVDLVDNERLSMALAEQLEHLAVDGVTVCLGRLLGK
ncbi:mannitol dehydrogenase family protein [Simiduia curdlanivorans]|uniref:Mannitol dehydrogenase family protein n=1 Tax=Simiduia curdlanivorans TaxID=1492769 RepID=A0ABV8V152_9GAMM|nr:mannitol dehydrogenase family protein [Simiduia curdlanivorans]MDN3637543.1 mannitol dehydrogenase family protein [Simiduia curdlanivorans]